MATRKKKATRKGAPKGKTKRSAKTSKRKVAKKTRKKSNRKALLTALIRKPMAELVKKGGLISEAITVKVQNQLRRTGQLSGPRPPNKVERAAMKRESERAALLRRFRANEQAAATRAIKRHGFIGPIMSNEALDQRATRAVVNQGFIGPIMSNEQSDALLGDKIQGLKQRSWLRKAGVAGY